MKKKELLKRAMCTLLAGTMVLGLTACGNADDKDSAKDSLAEEFVYVPQYYDIQTGEEAYLSDMSIAGDKIYYSVVSYGEDMKQEWFYRELADLSAAPTLIREEVNDATGDYVYRQIDVQLEDGSNIFLETVETANYEETPERFHFLKKTDAEGNLVFEVDFNPFFTQAGEYHWVSEAAVDKDGNIYITNGDTHMWVFDKDGNSVCTVNLETALNYSWVHALGVLPDGRVAVLTDGTMTSGLSIIPFDLEKKQFSDVHYDNLPQNCYNTDLNLGPDGGVLLNANDALYEYDMETETYTVLCKWLDCDMNPDYINDVYCALNGEIVVYYNDWNTNESNIVLLKKTPATEVVKKEVLTLGCMYVPQNIQAAVVDFNKSNEQYKIEVVEYMADIDWNTSGETAYDDATTRFLNDLISGNGPDMFMSGDVNLALFVEKGVVEDLTPYLESSQLLKKEDMFASVLDVMTIDGVLCAIPSTFNIATLVGRTAEVGEEPGWTMDELMAYLAQYPDAQMLSFASPNSILMYSLMFDMDSYIDWETGECSFDTPEFKKVLELAASYYGVEPDYDTSLPKQLANHEVLLDLGSFSAITDYQVQKLMFGEDITVIGYPTKDGQGGIAASVNDAVCINASSGHKDVAWTFIESQLTEEALKNNVFGWGFPINRNLYNMQLEDAMTPTYMLDEEGNQMLDENGEPIEMSNHSYGYDDVTFELYAATQEEADAMMDIIESIDSVSSYDEQLMNIVFEEADSYFAGQKDVDAVADVIQSRVKIYVNESR